MEWRRRSEQAACRRGGVSLTSQILYPRELKHLVVVRYVLKDANVLSTDFYFSLSICAYSTLASSVSLPASHCQAGALMFVPVLQHKTHCVGYLCTVQYRMLKKKCVQGTLKTSLLQRSAFHLSLKMNVNIYLVSSRIIVTTIH